MSEPLPENPQPDERRTGGNPPAIKVGPNEILRFILELFALFTLGFWGYLAWPFPWPGVVFMIATPLFAAVIWGLFRSPKAPIKVDPVGRGIVEIAVMGSAVIAWAMLGHPVIAVAFGIIALVSGIINLRAETQRDHATQEARQERAT